MRYLRFWLLLPVVILCLGLVGSPALAAGKGSKTKKKAVKTVELVLKVSNLAKAKKADVKKLKAAVAKVKGVKKVRIKKKAGELKIKHLANANQDAIKSAVEDAGFELEGREEEAEDEGEGGDFPDE
jgi:copper chaperone CopZ